MEVRGMLVVLCLVAWQIDGTYQLSKCRGRESTTAKSGRHVTESRHITYSDYFVSSKHTDPSRYGISTTAFRDAHRKRKPQGVSALLTLSRKNQGFQNIF